MLKRCVMGAIDTRDRLRVQGVEPQIQSSDQFRDKVRSEIERAADKDKDGVPGSCRRCRT
jgi:hypothetical protein